MKKLTKTLAFLSLMMLLVTPAYAMHIMEGFLPLGYCIFWAVLCIPSLYLGLRKIGGLRKQESSILMLLAMAGAYAFVLSALKFPSVTGSSSHPTGMGLVAILFGPTVGAVIGLIVLLFQAILLAHGGLTTLGANTFSMGIVGPLVSFLIYKSMKKSVKNRSLVVFLAASLGDLATYVITSIQLALAHPAEVGGFMASLTKFMGIFALTQVPIAIIEGILTVIVFSYLDQLASKEVKLLEGLL